MIPPHPLLASLLGPAVDFFVKGGFFMILLLALSIAALAIILLRGSALRFAAVIPPQVARAVENFRTRADIPALRDVARSRPSALSRIVAVALGHLDWPRSENIEAVQTRARHEIARMEAGLVVLEISTGVAPLLGLLGTLSGLVGIFANLGGTGDPVAVARGISEALNTTIMGLGVSVPCLVAHSYFMRKVEVMAIEMESLAADLIARCYLSPPVSEAPQTGAATRGKFTGRPA